LPIKIMNMIEGFESNLIYKIVKYGVYKEQFTVKDLSNDLNLSQLEQSFVVNFLLCINSNSASNYIMCTLSNYPENHRYDNFYRDSLITSPCRLLPDYLFKYVDYLEIKEARENSIKAHRQALKANRNSIIAIVITVLIGLVQCVLAYLQLKNF
jgi:hypothetical protein